MAHTSRRFREELRRELPRWQEDGLVSPDAAAALHVRYALGEVQSGVGLLPVYVLGCLLVGGGVISLVAYHWESMWAWAKLSLIVAALVACHGGGWRLWKGTGRMARLGHALTFLGTLVFGASLGLVAQIFQVSGEPWKGYAAFALGAFAAGLLYESVPHLLLAAVLALGVAGPWLASDNALPGIGAAWALAVVFLAVAWQHRSRTLAVVTAVGLGTMLGAGLLDSHDAEAWVLLAACLGAALAATPLAVAPLASRSDTGARLSGALRVLGRVTFCVAAYLLSFKGLASEFRLRGVEVEVLAAVLPALAFAAAALVVGLRRPEVEPLARGEAMLLGGAGLAFCLGLQLEHGAGAAVVANLALAFLAAGRIVRGLTSLARAPFWEGIALGGLVVVSRFLELQSELWLKGAAFIVAGVAVLAAGIAFERRRAAATAELT